MKGECSENPVPELQAVQEEIQVRRSPLFGLALPVPGTAVPNHQLPHQMWPLVAFHNSLVL